MASETETVTVTGMTCEHCVRAVTEELTKLEGVRHVEVQLATGQVTLHTAAPVSPDAVRAAVEEAGYEVRS